MSLTCGAVCLLRGQAFLTFPDDVWKSVDSFEELILFNHIDHSSSGEGMAFPSCFFAVFLFWSV